MVTVGAYELKTHLAELLSRPESGNRVWIARHGRKLARRRSTAVIGVI